MSVFIRKTGSGFSFLLGLQLVLISDNTGLAESLVVLLVFLYHAMVWEALLLLL